MSFRIPSRAFAHALRGVSTRAVCSRTLPSFWRYGNLLVRGIQTSPVRRDRSFTNLLADDIPPAVQVSSITEDGILLADGLLLPSSCIFHDGHVFLWDVPQNLWEGWETERFGFFESTVPRPGKVTISSSLGLELTHLVEILVLGTGRTLAQPPPSIRSYLNGLGIQLDVMDTVSH
jgi:uncharacterized protein